MTDEDRFDLDDDVEDTPDPKANAREQYERRAERKTSKLQTQLDEALQRIQAYEAKETERTVTSVFTEAELNPKWAKWYLNDNAEGEHTADRARTWAAEHGLVQPPEGAETSPAAPEAQGWTPTLVSGGPVEAGSIDYDKAMELLASDPSRLEREFLKGNVVLEKLPGNQ